MEQGHTFRGRLKRLWLFFVVMFLATLVSNIASQILFHEEIDILRAASIALMLGIVLTLLIAMYYRNRTR